MLVSRNSLTCWAVGEAWKRPFTGRTLFSLQRIGLPSQTNDFWALESSRPPEYPELVRDAIERTGPARYALIVPSGMVAGPRFAKALNRYLAAARPHNAELSLSSIQDYARCSFLAEGTVPGESTTRVYKLHQLRRHLIVRYPRGLQSTTAVPVPSDVIPRYAIQQGQHLFEELGRARDRLAFERPLAPMRHHALRAAAPGWAYQWNTEPVGESFPEALGCDTLVAVASGIKPWHLANELRSSLKRLVLIDASLPQLRFAFQAFEANSHAQSWSAICQIVPQTSIPDEAYRHQHDLLYERLRACRHEWNFEPTFFHCDVLAQTFRLIELIKAYRPRKLVFWYSNIFHPYFGERYTEDHDHIETDFVRLFHRQFPGVLLYNSCRDPIPCPR